MKRLIDILLSGLALLAIAPLLIPVAIALRFSGEGDVFYFQDRVGKDGKLFKMFKFVTMRRDSELIGTRTLTLKDDPRVLPLGRILRKAKINELPQLLNVLLGDMSIIGPRPLTKEQFDLFPQEMQETILQVSPGLSGVGSIMFRDEENIISRSQKGQVDCYAEDVMPYKGALEVWYVNNRSLALDLALICLTVYAILFPKSDLPRKLLKDLPQPPVCLQGLV